MAKDDKKVRRGVYLYIDGKEIKNDINSIDLEVKRLQRDIKDMTRGSEEYNRTMSKIQHLQGILKEHRKEIRGVTEETKKSTFSMGKLADGFNRFGGVIVSVIGFLTGFALALRSIREERNKLEESQAGLKALTGLDDDSITWLTAQAKTLSTTMTKEGLRVRQSAAEILDAFMLVGSAKPELLGNKEALKQVTEEAMRLQSAAKDITLNEAVDSLTLSLNQYGAAVDQANRFVNVLAAGSKEGAVNIASQAKAIQKAGTMAATLNIPIEELVGTIEMLGEKGVKDEIAGTGLKTFFTRLATGATDTNPKVVGLANALDNLNKQVEAAEAKQAGGGTSLLKKIFGDEGLQTAMILTQNVEQVKKYTEAVTDTNIAYEQSAINSATAAAKLDQARNSMKLAAIELGEKLSPAFTVSTNMMTNVIKFLPGLIDWFQKWGSTIVWVSIIIATYTLRMKAITVVTAAWNTVTKISTAIQLAYGIAMNTVNGYTVTSLTQTRKLSVVMAGHNVLMKVLRTSTYLYAASVYLLRGRVDLCAKSMKAAWVVMSLNPLGLLAALFLSATIASYKLTKRTKEYYDLNKVNEIITEKVNGEYDRQTSLVEQLTTKIHNNNLSNIERKKAIEQLKIIIPGYNAEIDKEGKIINENTTALDRYNTVLATNIELKEVAEELGIHRINLNRLKESPSLTDNSLMGSMAREDTRNKISQEEEIVASLTARYKKLVKEKWQALNPPPPKSPNSTNGNDGKCPKCGNTPCTCNPYGTDKGDKDKFAKVEEDYNHRISAIKKKYLDDDTMTKEQYSEQMQQAEMQLLNDKLAIAGLEPKEMQKLADKVLDVQIKLRNDMRELEKKNQEDAKKTREKTSEETFSRLDKEYQLQIEEATMFHYKNRTSEDEYYEELRRLQEEYYNSVLNDTNVSEEIKQKIRKQSNETQLEDEKNAYDKELAEFNMLKDNMIDAAEQLGDSMADFFLSEEQSFGAFMGNILTIVLDYIEKELIARQAAAIATITMNEITLKGLLGIATAAAKIALITAAFGAAKGILGNFYTGGYTSSGDWNQPQGIVHSNEFVANRYAVANPAIRPVLDLIDSAQRTGSIANLTSEDIASVVPHYLSAVSSGLTGRGSESVQVTDPALLAMLNECSHAIRLLKIRLDEPFVTENYVTGRHGIEQTLNLYNKLKSNVSRP